MFETNNRVFRSPYLVVDAPEVLFQKFKECVEMALLGKNPYTDCQLITNVIHLLLTTGLYTHPFKEWDCLTPIDQTWITIHTMIQEAFQWCLNATAPIAGHHGYAPMLPFQNACGALEDKDFNDNSVAMVATQVAAFTYQSQFTASTAAVKGTIIRPAGIAAKYDAQRHASDYCAS
jgi:hypothetical protein